MEPELHYIKKKIIYCRKIVIKFFGLGIKAKEI